MIQAFRFPRRRAAAPLPVCLFCHLPRTGGQAMHAALSAQYGAAECSPVRTHSQATPGAAQLPPGYRLYSGHIDWDRADALPPDTVSFTLLREPLTRIASFWFYLRAKAASLPPQMLDRPDHTGLRRAATCSAKSFFLGGGPDWQRFVRDHFDNAQTRYLATGRQRGTPDYEGLDDGAKLARARVGAQRLTGVYRTDRMAQAAEAVGAALGRAIRVPPAVNAGDVPSAEAWPRLAAELGAGPAAQVARFGDLDRRLLSELVP